METSKTFFVRLLRCLWAAFIATTLCACGGGGGASASGSAGGAPASITFGTTALAVAPGSRLFLRATANFADGHSQDITSTSTWASANPAVATVGTTDGIVAGVSNGQSDVTVTYNGVSAVAHIQVGSILGAIDIIVPAQLGIGVGATFRFSALGQFTDGARDVTQSVAWTSSNPTIATVGTTAGQQGLTTGLSPGPVTITARSGNVTKAISLTVLPIQTLESSESNSTVVQFGALGVDASGQALTVWNHRFSPAGTADLFYSRQSAATGWTTAAPIRTVARVEISSPPHLAMNASGAAVMAWHQIDGLYASTYAPAVGWSAPVNVAVQSLEDGQLQLGVGIDGAGNALLTWKADASASFVSSVMAASTGSWSAPSLITGSNGPGCIPMQARLVDSAAGVAVLAWTRSCTGTGTAPLGAQELLASSWTAQSGWQPPVSMGIGAGADFAVANNDVGDAQMAWIITTANPTPGTQSPYVGSIYSRSLSALGRWGPIQTVASGLTRQPLQPQLAVNVQGVAVLAWANAFDDSVSTSRFDANGFWAQPVDLYRPALGDAGNPMVLKPSLTDDGRALVSWLASDLSIVGQVVTARYLPATGWEQSQTLSYTGRRGLVTNVNIEFDHQGRGAIFWLESAASGFNLYANSLSF